jgi:hypothetical protein
MYSHHRNVIVILSGFLILLSNGCSPRLYKEPFPSVQPDPLYDHIYPYYVELCAVSQIRAKFAKHGGTPGHAVMYLKGVCRDPGTEFPTIKICDAGLVDLNDFETGVGVSVNKLLKNVNWIAVPGKSMFFRGNLEDGQLLNEDHARATIQAAQEMGIFDGIEIHERYKPPEEDTEATKYLLAKETLGTDFALRFGRTIFCTRLPVTLEMMEKIVAYLNGLNREYATGEADYNWSGYYDNCSHTLHNALAAAGVWSFKSVQSFKLKQFFNLSIPANEFADLAIMGTTYSIENFYTIFRDKVKRTSLLENNWLPTQHGALLKRIAVHQNNDLYDTGTRLFVLQTPFLRPKSRKVNAMYYEPRYTQLRANLYFFKDRYEKILEERPEDWDETHENNDYKRARRIYYQYIKQQLDDVNEKLSSLRQMH